MWAAERRHRRFQRAAAAIGAACATGSRSPDRDTPERDRAYACWAATYRDVAHNPLMRAEQRAMRQLIGDVTGAVALDLGTGPGRYRRLLSGAGAVRVYGVDRSMPMLRRGSFAGRTTDRLICADARAVPLPGASIDVIVAGLMAGDLASLDRWLREMGRVLRPGGRLVYSDFHESWTRRGWRRTFEDAHGARHVIPHVTHSLREHLSALVATGFIAVRVVQVTLDPSDVRARSDRRHVRPSPDAPSGGSADPSAVLPVCTVFAAARPVPTRAPHAGPRSGS